MAEALLEKMELLAEPEKKPGGSLLEELIMACSGSGSMAGLLVELINEVYWAATIRRELLRVFLRALLVGEAFQVIPTVLERVKEDFALCYKNQLEHFSDRSNARVFLNRAIHADRLEL